MKSPVTLAGRRRISRPAEEQWDSTAADSSSRRFQRVGTAIHELDERHRRPAGAIAALTTRSRFIHNL